MTARLRKARRFFQGLLFGRRRETRLAILVHPGRTGSTLLGDLLDQHESIDWAGEIFSKVHRSERHHLMKSFLWRLRNPLLRDGEGRVLWRETLERRRQRSALPILGVEIKTNQIFRQRLFGPDPAAALAALNAAADLPLIFLHRRNHLERYVSAAAAKLRSRHNFESGQSPERIEVPIRGQLIDPAYFGEKMEINDWLDRVVALEAELAALVQACGGLCLSYEEDIAADPAVAYAKAVRHLGQEPGAAIPRLIKIDGRPLADRLSNPERLKKILRADLYARFCRP